MILADGLQPANRSSKESTVSLPTILLMAAILPQDKPPEPVTVKKVLSVTLTIDKGTLTLMAVGEVPTGGYTRPTLTRVTYIKQPDDGIQDYTFQATPPAGPATQVISQVKASDTWSALPAWVKGVRIHGVGDGVLVKMIGEK
jgi:hypothetical protein